jgi:hypothetical protein
MDPRYPDWLLERILLHEVPRHWSERARMAQEDPEVQLRLEAMRRDDQRFREAPSAPALAEIRRVAEGLDRTDAAARRQARRRRWGVGIPVAALVLVVATVPWHGHQQPAASALLDGRVSASSASSPAPASSSTGTAEAPVATAPENAASQVSLPLAAPSIATEAGSEIRAKGDAVALSIHRQGQGRAERLTSGDTVRPHDLLQISLEARKSVFACVLSLDATGNITAHLPEVSASAIAMEPGKRMVLPHAYELDDSRGFERFWLIWSDRPFETSQLSAHLRALPATQRTTATLDLPAGFSQFSILLPKATR